MFYQLPLTRWFLFTTMYSDVVCPTYYGHTGSSHPCPRNGRQRWQLQRRKGASK